MDDSLRTPLMIERCQLMQDLIYDIHLPNEPTQIFKRAVPSPALLREKHPDKSDLHKMKITQVDLCRDDRPIGIVVTDNRGFSGNSAKSLASLMWSVECVSNRYGSLLGLLVQDVDPEKASSIHDMNNRLATARMEIVYDLNGVLSEKSIDHTGGTVEYDGKGFSLKTEKVAVATPPIAALVRSATLSKCHAALYKIHGSAKNIDEISEIARVLSFGKWQFDTLNETETVITDNPYTVASVRSGIRGCSDLADERAVATFKSLCGAWLYGFAQMGCSFDYNRAAEAGHIEELGHFFGIDSMVSAIIDEEVDPEWVLGDYADIEEQLYWKTLFA